MKNIFIYSSDGFPTKKNPNLGIFNFEQGKALKKYKVHFFDLSTNNTKEILFDNYDGFVIYRLLNCRFNIFKILNNFFFIKKISKKYKPLIIIASFLNIKNVIYSLFINSKKIVLIHGSDANTKGFIRKFIFKFYLNKLDKIICVSNYTKKILLKNYKSIKKKIKVVHNGFSREKLNKIDYQFKKKITRKRKISILTVANLVPRKNISDVIKIFNKINLKMKNKFHLNIVGQGSEKNDLLNLIKYYKLEQNINIFSNLSNSKLASIFETSKFFFLFSKNYRHEFEGFGIVFLEAMYKKNIIFASKNGGMTDILKNNKNAFTFNAENQNYRNKVLQTFFKIIANKSLQKKIIKNGLNYSKNFSWEKNINLIINSL